MFEQVCLFVQTNNKMWKRFCQASFNQKKRRAKQNQFRFVCSL
ncbi:hypothetical protein RV11_GL000062 [Enterococcus phoeniculicola]|nr:hypothetical protein RV11_GL000062 [Enterococcus phoeniculicola]